MVKGVESFAALRVSASGLSAQRIRMDVLAENIANASTTRTDDGGPYQRKVVTLGSRGDVSAAPPESFGSSLRESLGLARTDSAHRPNGRLAQPSGEDPPGVEVVSIDVDRSEGPVVYDPTHPDADENGYVRMPNVEIIEELMTLTGAARVYEANLAAMKAAQDAARDTLRIGQ